MFQHFKYLSLSHQRAPVEIRELIYLNETDCHSVYTILKDYLPLTDVLVFSTCNRTEIYYHSETNCAKELITVLGHVKGIANIQQYASYFEHVEDASQTIQYLFEVSAGLHSAVLGDIQISNQIKKAYKLSVEMNAAGHLLHRLMHSIFHANKRIHQETLFREGVASISYAAVQLADSLATQIVRPKALVIGMGEMGREVAINLKNTAIEEITVCNRTLEKAEALAQEYSYQVLPFEELARTVAQYDIVVVGASAEKPIIKADYFKDIPFKLRFVIDIAVPRGVESELAFVQGVSLYNIDDFVEQIDKSKQERARSIPKVKEILQESMAEFMDWTKELEISPVINRMKEALEQIRNEELNRYVKNISSQEYQLVDTVTKNLMQKVLKLPVLQLKAACQRGEAETLIDVLNDLFNLEKAKAK